jgi:hypothetical protein
MKVLAVFIEILIAKELSIALKTCLDVLSLVVTMYELFILHTDANYKM